VTTRDIADTADCMAHCVENEALLFECLKTEALAAAKVLRALAASNSLALAEGEPIFEEMDMAIKQAKSALGGGVK